MFGQGGSRVKTGVQWAASWLEPLGFGIVDQISEAATLDDEVTEVVVVVVGAGVVVVVVGAGVVVVVGAGVVVVVVGAGVVAGVVVGPDDNLEMLSSLTAWPGYKSTYLSWQRAWVLRKSS